MNRRILNAEDFNFVPIKVAVRVTGVSRERILAMANHGIIESGFLDDNEDMVSLPSICKAVAEGYECAVTRSLDHSQVYEIDGTEYVTPPGAAILLGVSTAYVDSLVKSGRLPDTLIGARRFVRYEVVAEYQTQTRVQKDNTRVREKLLADVAKTQQRLSELLKKAGLEDTPEGLTIST